VLNVWLSLAAGVALLAAALVGWGALAARALALPGRAEGGTDLPGPFDCGVLGAAALFAAGALWSFGSGLSPLVSDLALAVGLAGCATALGRRWWSRRQLAGQALLALSLVALLAWGALRTPLNFDTGLYHLQHLQWLRAGPLPFGLAQLHERLGFNSAWMTVTALVGGTRAHPDATYLVGAALATLVLGALLWRARAAVARRRLDFASAFALLAAILLLSGAPHGLFSWFALSPSNDLPAALLSLYALSTGAALLSRTGRGARELPPPGLVAAFAASGALAVAVKLSQLPIALAVAAALSLLAWRSASSRATGAIGRAAIVAGGLAVIWLAQNVALSGCLIFPRAETCSSALPWTLDRATVTSVDEVVRAWARAPGENFLELAASADWPRAWVERMLPERRLLHHLAVATPALALLLLAGRWTMRRWPRAATRHGVAVWTLAAAATGVGVCALSAPDPRFAYGALIGLAAGLLATLVPASALSTARRALSLRACGAAAVVVAAGVALFASPAASAGATPAWRALPQPDHTLRQLPEGLVVRVPTGTEQCFALPLPCAPARGRELHAEQRWGRWVFLRPTAARATGVAFEPRPANALAARWELLGFELVPLLELALDALLLLLVSASAARRLGGAQCSPVRRLLATGLVGLALMVGVATWLGAIGRLTHGNLVSLPRVLAALVVLAALRRGGARGGWDDLVATAAYPFTSAKQALLASWHRRQPAAGWRLERTLLAAGGAVLALYALLALAAQPLNWDAQAYRLARIALWLQEGSLAHLATNDSRLNFVGHNADLVMLWLVSYFRRGFPLVHLVQYGGGLLACLATVEIGAQLGLSRGARLAAALTLLGIPTFGLQFFTAQTDLFVAGALVAGLAFLLPALRHGRWSEWLLVGLGVGLALGAKGTVLYWGLGLVVLLAGWATSVRADLRRSLAGAALALAVALSLAGFNFAQNWRAFGNPFAPESAIERSHLPAPAPSVEAAPAPLAAAASARLWPSATNAVAMLWQLLAPSSNPLLPERLLAPPFDALLGFLAEHSLDYRILRRSLAESGGWAGHGLSEDEASFGLVVPLLAMLGGAWALGRALTRGRTASDLRWAAMALAVALFLGFFCVVSQMTLYQYRYFCLVAPFAALLAVAVVDRWHGPLGFAFAAAFVAGQVAVALHLGVASEYHGLGAVIDPRRSQYDFRWSEPRALIRELGAQPLAIGLALPRDSWIAPYLRTGAGHRFRLIPAEELAATDSVTAFLERSGLDALVVAPELAPPLGDEVRALAAPRLFSAARRIALRPLRAGEAARPLIVVAQNVTSDGWARGTARFRLEAWPAVDFALELENPTPLSVHVEMRSEGQSRQLELAPGAAARIAVAVSRRDEVALVASPLVDATRQQGSAAPPRAGVRLAPERVIALEGLFSDGWSAPRARLQLRNWLGGTYALELVNPAAVARDVELSSAVETVRARVAAGGSARLTVAVLPQDALDLVVTPALAASSLGGDAADPRWLGVLLRGESWRQLLRDWR
jgi:4-amino-4-deoxy-L-arabinose transferase-like glycosyltransferase